MKAKLDCFSCYLRIGLQAARMAGADEAAQKVMMAEFFDILKDSLNSESPLSAASRMQSVVSRHTGNTDPYAEAKRQCNALAESCREQIREEVKGAKDTLTTALKVAAIGNIMDYGAFSHFNLEALLEQLHQRQFALDSTERFRKALKTAKTLAYLTDNAGEIVLDQLLLEHICQAYALEEVRVIIREKPFLNDVADISEVPPALLQLPQVKVEALSILPEERNEALWERIMESDLILCKGMANFEKFSAEREFYFLLISKCDLVSRHLSEHSAKEIQTGDWIFVHGQDLLPEET